MRRPLSSLWCPSGRHRLRIYPSIQRRCPGKRSSVDRMNPISPLLEAPQFAKKLPSGFCKSLDSTPVLDFKTGQGASKETIAGVPSGARSSFVSSDAVPVPAELSVLRSALRKTTPVSGLVFPSPPTPPSNAFVERGDDTVTKADMDEAVNIFCRKAFRGIVAVSDVRPTGG